LNRVDTALVVGVGLVGGSLAAAWRKVGYARRVLGFDRNLEAANVAVERGLIDESVTELPAHVDVLVVCTPSDQIAAQIAQCAAHADLIMDVGSVKEPILETLRGQYGGVPENYVPCHPIAGSELSGPTAASADLFDGALVVLTPETESRLSEVAAAAWECVGAQVSSLSAAAHDQMLAVTSHLPHLLASAYMQQVEAPALPFTGGGFKDFTRIAAANPELWWRILSMNKAHVIAAAEEFITHLKAFTDTLEAGDQVAGVQALSEAARLRQQL